MWSASLSHWGVDVLAKTNRSFMNSSFVHELLEKGMIKKIGGMFVFSPLKVRLFYLETNKTCALIRSFKFHSIFFSRLISQGLNCDTTVSCQVRHKFASRNAAVENIWFGWWPRHSHPPKQSSFFWVIHNSNRVHFSSTSNSCSKPNGCIDLTTRSRVHERRTWVLQNHHHQPNTKTWKRYLPHPPRAYCSCAVWWEMTVIKRSKYIYSRGIQHNEIFEVKPLNLSITTRLRDAGKKACSFPEKQKSNLLAKTGTEQTRSLLSRHTTQLFAIKAGISCGKLARWKQCDALWNNWKLLCLKLAFFLACSLNTVVFKRRCPMSLLHPEKKTPGKLDLICCNLCLSRALSIPASSS